MHQLGTILEGSSVTAVTKHSVCSASTCYCALNKLSYYMYCYIIALVLCVCGI